MNAYCKSVKLGKHRQCLPLTGIELALSTPEVIIFKSQRTIPYHANMVQYMPTWYNFGQTEWFYVYKYPHASETYVPYYEDCYRIWYRGLWWASQVVGDTKMTEIEVSISILSWCPKHIKFMRIRLCTSRKLPIKLLQISHYEKHGHRTLSQQLP